MRLTPRMSLLRLHRFFRHIDDRLKLRSNIYSHDHVLDIVTSTVPNNSQRKSRLPTQAWGTRQLSDRYYRADEIPLDGRRAEHRRGQYWELQHKT